MFAVATGLCAVAQSNWDRLVYRTLAGLGLGGEFGIGMSAARLPRVDLPEILLKIASRAAFTDPFTHLTARTADLNIASLQVRPVPLSLERANWIQATLTLWPPGLRRASPAKSPCSRKHQATVYAREKAVRERPQQIA